MKGTSDRPPALANLGYDIIVASLSGSAAVLRDEDAAAGGWLDEADLARALLELGAGWREADP